MFAGQCSAGNRSGVVVKADERIELRLVGWGIANCPCDFISIPAQFGLEVRIALLNGPDRGVINVGPGRCLTDCPGRSARCGIRIGFNQAVFA